MPAELVVPVVAASMRGEQPMKPVGQVVVSLGSRELPGPIRFSMNSSLDIRFALGRVVRGGSGFAKGQ
jgi:hypothetical protein